MGWKKCKSFFILTFLYELWKTRQEQNLMYPSYCAIDKNIFLLHNIVTQLNNKAEIIFYWYKNNFLLENKEKFQVMF